MNVRTVVVARAPDIVSAQIWVDALGDAGIQARLFERGPGAALGGAITSGITRYPVIVAEDDFAVARTVIGRLAGMDVLQPLPDTDAEDARRRWALITVVGLVVGIVVVAFILQLAAR
jgi:hypothetical protein